MCSAGSLVALLSAAVLSGHFAAGEQPPASRKPNFVVFVVDDLGYSDVGCFGNHSLPTPNIDSLCETGVKLAHNLAASPVCTPSRAALLTGRYPVEIGMEASRLNRVFLNLGSTGGLPPDVTTFPTILRQEAGYSTALVGKWHLGLHCGFPPDFCHHPNSHGFDYFYGLPLTNVRDFGNDETTHSSVLRPFAHLIKTLWVSLAVSFIMFLYFITKRSCCFSLVCLAISIAIMLVVMPLHNFRAFSGVLMRNTEVIQQPVDLDGLTGRYVQEALNYLHNQDENKPFLLFMAFTHVHTALVPGKGFKGRSNFGPYGDAVLEVDWAVGEVLQKLDDLKLTEDTVIYFTSDNGAHQEETMGDGTPAGGSNYPFKGGKGMGSMEGGIRVPSIIKYPRKFPPGQVVNVPTSQMDLLPTFANLAGVKLWENLTQVDGRDLSNLLSGQTDQSPHSVLLHYCGTYLHGARWVEDHKKVWKVRFAQPKFVPGTHRCEFLCFCSPGDVDILEPPLLFNVQEDLTEDEPVDPNSELYDKVMGMIAEKIREHELAMEEDPPEDQFSVLNSIWRPWLQPCCDFGKMCSCNENSD